MRAENNQMQTLADFMGIVPVYFKGRLFLMFPSLALR